MILLFPGFFSHADDYLEFQKELGDDVQIFDYAGLTSTPLTELGAKISSRISKPVVAIGYSMGGRVLLEAIKYSPQNFSAVCFISTNPGLKSEPERQQRYTSDQQWAQKFLTMPWHDLVREWNAQPVFSGVGKEPDRQENKFDRKVLSETLRNWSLGLQTDQRPVVENLSVPNLWITGANDPKFCGFLKDLNVGKKTQTRVIADSGHRVHLDQPKSLAKVFKAWND